MITSIPINLQLNPILHSSRNISSSLSFLKQTGQKTAYKHFAEKEKEKKYFQEKKPHITQNQTGYSKKF